MVILAPAACQVLPWLSVIPLIWAVPTPRAPTAKTLPAVGNWKVHVEALGEVNNPGKPNPVMRFKLIAVGSDPPAVVVFSARVTDKAFVTLKLQVSAGLIGPAAACTPYCVAKRPIPSATPMLKPFAFVNVAMADCAAKLSSATAWRMRSPAVPVVKLPELSAVPEAAVLAWLPSEAAEATMLLNSSCATWKNEAAALSVIVMRRMSAATFSAYKIWSDWLLPASLATGPAVQMFVLSSATDAVMLLPPHVAYKTTQSPACAFLGRVTA